MKITLLLIAALEVSVLCTEHVRTSNICTEPKIMIPDTPINVYKDIEEIEVAVYSCHYQEEISIYRCNNKQQTDEKLSTKKLPFSDFSQNCINAFTMGSYRDVDGDAHNLDKTNKTHTFTKITKSDLCTGNINRERHITITLTEYTAVADVKQGTLTLRSGVICPYRSRYCYDRELDSEVVWSVMRKDNSAKVDCNKLKKISIKLSPYYVTLDRVYLILDINGSMIPLEAGERHKMCGVQGMKVKGLFVSEGNIKKAKLLSNSNTINDFQHIYFDDKQRLLRYLVYKCYRDTGNFSDTPDIGDLFRAVTKAFTTCVNPDLDQRNTVEEQGEVIEKLRGRLSLINYLVIGVLVCVLCCFAAVFYVVCMVRRKCINAKTPTGKCDKVKVHEMNAYPTRNELRTDYSVYSYPRLSDNYYETPTS